MRRTVPTHLLEVVGKALYGWGDDEPSAATGYTAVYEATKLAAAIHVAGYERSAGAAPLDVPPEAIEWARELVRQGYRDEHVVTFSKTGYGLQHPIRCRPNLIGCQMNEWLATQMAPDEEPGRYVMTWDEYSPEYARLLDAASPSAETGADE